MSFQLRELILVVRLYVHEHLGDLSCGAQNCVLDGMSDLVPDSDRYFSVNDDVEIDIIAKSHLANVALFQANNALYSRSDRTNLLFDLRSGSGVQQLCHWAPKLPPCVEGDDGRRTKSGPVIRSSISSPECDGDPDQNEARGDRIAEVMLSVALAAVAVAFGAMHEK
jgi:hypothetical protein